MPTLVAEVVEEKVPLSFLLTLLQLTKKADETNSTIPANIRSISLCDFIFTFFGRSANGRNRAGRRMFAEEAATVSLQATAIT